MSPRLSIAWTCRRSRSRKANLLIVGADAERAPLAECPPVAACDAVPSSPGTDQPGNTEIFARACHAAGQLVYVARQGGASRLDRNQKRARIFRDRAARNTGPLGIFDA